MTALALSACGAQGTGEPDWSTVAEPIWESSERLISDVAIAGDVALAYVSTGDGNESLVARDLSTGSELWRDQTLPGIDGTGVAHRVATLEADGNWSVAYLQQSGSDYRWAALAVVDARTGTALGTSSEDQWLLSTRPTECGETYCLEGWMSGADENKAWQFDMKTHLLTESSGAGTAHLEGGAFFIGTNVVAGADDDGLQTLSYRRDGEYVWTRDYTDVFGPGTSTRGGWAWVSEQEDIPLIGVGFGYSDRDTSTPGPMQFELGRSRTVGLDSDSGATLWAHDRAENCQTGGEMLVEGVLVLCRYNSGAGSFDWTGDRGENLRYDDVDLDIIGVDPSDGTIRWEVSLGDEPANYDEDAPRLNSGTNPIVVKDGQALMIDRQTGSTTRLPEHAALVCTFGFDEPVELWAAFPVDERSDYWIKHSMPCAGDGTAYLGGQYSYGSLEAAGYDTAEISVLAGSAGMVAFAASAKAQERVP